MKHEMKKGRNLSELSLKVLSSLFKATAWTIQGFIEVHNYDEFVRKRVYKQLYNLRSAGYVKIRNEGRNISFFHLTPKGRLKILKYLHLEKLRPKKWDRQWRVIIFDIPERLKKWREYLRHDLKNLGFIALQESVYITPYPVTGELDRLLKEWNLRKYFRYLTVSEIDGEEELKKEFGL